MTTADLGLPPPVREALAAPPLDRKPWAWGLAPHYIGLFLWIVYFDRLAPSTLAVGGLGPSLVGVVLAGLLCYGLLYYVPAMWGLRSGRPLPVVTTSTFGAVGATWVPGLVMILAQVAWFAVATFYTAELILGSLVEMELLDRDRLDPIDARRLTLGSPLFLVTTFVWCVVIGLVGGFFMRWIAALMNVFPVFPAVVMVVLLIATLNGLAWFRPEGLDPETLGAGPTVAARWTALLTMVQLIFGFFTMAGLMGADWGAASRDAHDVRVGGLVSVALAAIVLAALALVTIAGAIGLSQRPIDPDTIDLRIVAAGPSPRDADAFTYQAAIRQAIGGRVGGAMLMLFGLVSAAPACYAVYAASVRLKAMRPTVKRWIWLLVVAIVAWPLVATGAAGHLEAWFSLFGAFLAPVAGAMAGEYVRARGSWPGPRAGVNLAGVAAWAVGVLVGLAPILGRLPGLEPLTRLQPAAVIAFGTAFVLYLVLARLGLEPPVVPVEACPRPDATG